MKQNLRLYLKSYQFNSILMRKSSKYSFFFKQFNLFKLKTKFEIFINDELY